jgi:4-carboxymuconolactone decarboxylase
MLPDDIGTPDDNAILESRRKLGLQIMDDMLGPENVARIVARNRIAPDWHRWSAEVLFGDVWQGPGLTRRQRSVITVAALVPMSRSRELEIHMRAALINGVTAAELVEIVQHLGFYAGWPAAGEALTILKRIVDETEAAAGPDDQ